MKSQRKPKQIRSRIQARQYNARRPISNLSEALQKEEENNELLIKLVKRTREATAIRELLITNTRKEVKKMDRISTEMSKVHSKMLRLLQQTENGTIAVNHAIITIDSNLDIVCDGIINFGTKVLNEIEHKEEIDDSKSEMEIEETDSKMVDGSQLVANDAKTVSRPKQITHNIKPSEYGPTRSTIYRERNKNDNR